jgi:5-carboxymethyl-2-hydroxymuconate isomerase
MVEIEVVDAYINRMRQLAHEIQRRWSEIDWNSLSISDARSFEDNKKFGDTLFRLLNEQLDAQAEVNAINQKTHEMLREMDDVELAYNKSVELMAAMSMGRKVPTNTDTKN